MKYLVIVLWLVAVGVAGPFAIKLFDVVDNSSLSALPAGAESLAAQQLGDKEFPGQNRTTAVVVYARGSGLTDADRDKIEADRTAFAQFAVDGQVEQPQTSPDNQAALLVFPLTGPDSATEEKAGQVADLVKANVPDGLQVALTGEVGAELDINESFAGMDLTLLLASGIAVALLLLLTYRSPILWLIPLITVALANQLGSAVVYVLASNGVVILDQQSSSILTVLIFGLGVDYALLLIARYREELRRNRDRHVAMAKAWSRSMPAILASAVCVGLALLTLLAADLPATRGLGPIAAVGVLAALVGMATLLPAVLVLFGRWLFWPFIPRFDENTVSADIAAQHGIWGRIASVVGRRPRFAWIASVLVLGGVASGIGGLSIGLPHDQTFRAEVASVTGQKLIGAHFPGGTTGPADVYARADSADAVTEAVQGVSGVADVVPAQPSANGEWVHIQAVLTGEPESTQSQETVERLRDAVHAVPGAQAVVGGQSAAELDTQNAAARDNAVVMPLILVVVLIVLMILLRSLIAPLVLTGAAVLSFAAALGTAGFILVGMGRTHLFYSLPLQTFLFLVALGVDYTIFLMTRAREEVRTLGHREGVLHALTVTGGVITSAGLVLAATFATLSLLPLVPSMQTGIIIAVGVLIDTIIVRTVLIPALALDLGRKIWWPTHPARELPDGPADRPEQERTGERITAGTGEVPAV